MSNKTICKEQCTKCKCIVKERILNTNKKSDDCDDGAKCATVYRDLGECLQKAIVSASKKQDDDC